MIYSWPPTGRMSAGYSQSDDGDQLHSAVVDRRQGRLCGRPGQSRARLRLQQGALGRTRPIRRPPTCSCSGPARRRCRSRAACCPMRCAIRTASRTSSRTSMASSARARQDYLANLNDSANVGLLDPIMPGAQDYFAVARPHVHVGLGRYRSEGGARRRPRPNGTRPPSSSASTRRRRSTGVPEAAGRHRRQHGGKARHGGQARLTGR